MPPPTKIQLSPGYYFSPGFYMRYWQNVIEKNFDEHTILSNVRLKQHREVWIGAILAANQTKITGVKHFVGLPDTEPPDVEIVRYVPTKTKLGNDGTNLEKIGAEIVRCDLNKGEALLKQILMKNVASYSGLTVAVYVYGGGDVITDFNKLQSDIDGLDKIYPLDILVLGPVKATASIALSPGTFAVTKLYPTRGQDLVNAFDDVAFFDTPNVMTNTGRGVMQQAKHLGYIELLPPNIRARRTS